MTNKRLMVGESEWLMGDGEVDKVIDQVRTAMQDGAVVELHLLDKFGRPVTVLLNGKAAVTVVLDLNSGPRPSEISG